LRNAPGLPLQVGIEFIKLPHEQRDHQQKQQRQSGINRPFSDESLQQNFGV
jgi:hypothetical protein